jgi:hypothetical protein
MTDKAELLAKASKPAEEALRLHAYYKGKMQTLPKCAIRSLEDFSVWYTPGVAAPCKAIQADHELVYDYTNKGNTIAIVSDGTRVLGLGDIGPEAGLPVMEGKALLFKYLGGVDAVPICLDTKDPDELIRTVRLLTPSFGAINLEDIAMPKCFRILRELQVRLPDPGLARRSARNRNGAPGRSDQCVEGRRKRNRAGSDRHDRHGRGERADLSISHGLRGRSCSDCGLRCGRHSRNASAGV